MRKCKKFNIILINKKFDPKYNGLPFTNVNKY